MDGRTNNGNVSPSPPRFLLSFSHSIVVGSLFVSLCSTLLFSIPTARLGRLGRSAGRGRSAASFHSYSVLIDQMRSGGPRNEGERGGGERGRQMMKMMLSQLGSHPAGAQAGRQAGSPSLNSLARAEKEEEEEQRKKN